MTAGVIRLDGRTVLVEPPRIGVGLVLEAAEALIEEFGHRTGGRVETGDGTVLDSGKAGGFSLHDAVGGACEMVSGAEDVSGQAGKSDKEFSYTTRTGETASMRNEANQLVQQQLPDGETDITFNDKSSKDEVIDVIRRARQEATA